MVDMNKKENKDMLKDILKDMLKEWKMLIVIVICTSLVLLAINVSNNAENTINANNSNGTGNGMATNITTVDKNTYNTTGDDKNFTKWLAMTSRLLSNDLDCIVKAAKNENFTDTERCAKFLRENSDRALNGSNLHNNISANIVPVLDQYKGALKNYSIGGEFLEMGAKSKNATQMAIGSRYIDIADKEVLRAKHIYNFIGIDNSTEPIPN